MFVESKEDLQGLKAIGEIVANCLVTMKKAAKAGMTTLELDQIGQAYLKSFGARSAPMLVYDFPGATCISVNENAAHGIPNKQILKPGDLINIDVSAELNGYYADTGGSFVMTPASDEKQRLCTATLQALEAAIKVVTAGAKINETGRAVEEVARHYGLSIIRNLGGHGVGRHLHEDPGFIAGYYDRRDERVFAENMVITIEPFLSTGAKKVEDTEDGWTLATPGHLTAQYEHTLIVTRSQAILTTIPTL